MSTGPGFGLIHGYLSKVLALFPFVLLSLVVATVVTSRMAAGKGPASVPFAVIVTCMHAPTTSWIDPDSRAHVGGLSYEVR